MSGDFGLSLFDGPETRADLRQLVAEPLPLADDKKLASREFRAGPTGTYPAGASVVVTGCSICCSHISSMSSDHSQCRLSLRPLWCSDSNWRTNGPDTIPRSRNCDAPRTEPMSK